MNIGEFLAAHTCTTAPAKRSAQEEPFFISSNSHLLNMSVNKKSCKIISVSISFPDSSIHLPDCAPAPSSARG